MGLKSRWNADSSRPMPSANKEQSEHWLIFLQPTLSWDNSESFRLLVFTLTPASPGKRVSWPPDSLIAPSLACSPTEPSLIRELISWPSPASFHLPHFQLRVVFKVGRLLSALSQPLPAPGGLDCPYWGFGSMEGNSRSSVGDCVWGVSPSEAFHC